jgi:hypothetical protein
MNARSPQVGRRPVLVLSAAVAGIALAAAVGLVVMLRGSDAPGAAVPAAPTGPTAAITRQTLTESVSLPGELSHGTTTPLTVKATGTITWLPATGTVLERGDTVLRVDDRPVVLLRGDLPMYRELAPPRPAGSGSGSSGSGSSGSSGTRTPAGTSSGTAVASGPTGQSAGQGAGTGTTGDGTTKQPDETGSAAETGTAPAEPLQGRDVRQFEQNLRALGYTGFTVDSTYSERTAQAVRRWQRDTGMQVTGAVGPEQVIYTKGPVRIDRASARVGAEAGGESLAYSGTDKVATLDVPVADSEWAVRGAKVSVLLPGGKSVPGTVRRLGGVASRAQQEGETGESDKTTAVQEATVPVTVRIRDQKALTALDRAPVQVEYTSKERRDVLTVPVPALLALAEGGYGLEVVDGTGTRILPVRSGLFASGRVEVSGTGLRTGQLVRLPG